MAIVADTSNIRDLSISLQMGGKRATLLGASQKKPPCEPALQCRSQTRLSSKIVPFKTLYMRNQTLDKFVSPRRTLCKPDFHLKYLKTVRTPMTRRSKRPRQPPKTATARTVTKGIQDEFSEKTQGCHLAKPPQ